MKIQKQFMFILKTNYLCLIIPIGYKLNINNIITYRTIGTYAQHMMCVNRSTIQHIMLNKAYI